MTATTGNDAIWALGLMSGTSIDGVDAALIRTDGETVFEFGPSLSRTYAPEDRALIRAALGGGSGVDTAARVVTENHVEVVQALLAEAGLTPALIGFHGQTILHEPDRHRTWQIGDGAALAAAVGVDVVHDFRTADVSSGGQGAPFAPLYHAALARDLETPLAVLNLGGVGNVTWIGDPLIAFDTGPANALMDDVIATRTARAYDADGDLARQGQVESQRVTRWLENPYFAAPAPKSLDRDDFADCDVSDLSLEDGLATLAALTVRSVAQARHQFPAPVRRWLVTGGGRHNGYLMSELASALNAPVEPVEAVGWRGDSLEAEAFAFLAARSRRGLPLSLPTTTGVPSPMTGGEIAYAAASASQLSTYLPTAF